MSLFRAGSLWLFRLAGINVYVHWSWLLIVWFQAQWRAAAADNSNSLLPPYQWGMWHALQFLVLFAIVLLHEFGHALACLQVGGLANTIVLWPLGGIAFVKPPQRPGACLWTFAAGPLVNVALVPLLGGLLLLGGSGEPFVEGHVDWSAVSPDLPLFLHAVFQLNLLLLIFNLLPVYPLDGGQILQALLWFVIGRAESLMVASLLGMLVGGCAMLFASIAHSLPWFLMSAFVVLTAAAGFRHGRMLARLLRSPRRKDAVCPSCKHPPLLGNYWTCHECGTRFDIFEHHGQCPGCGQLYRTTPCPDCYQEHPIGEWFAAALTTQD